MGGNADPLLVGRKHSPKPPDERDDGAEFFPKVPCSVPAHM